MKFLLTLLLTSSIWANNFAQELYEVAQNAYIQKDYKKALFYYKEAAKEHNVNAMVKLGMMYYEGEFVKQGYSSAHKYFSDASKQGNIKATYYLGVLYANKKTIYYDLNKAYEILLSLESSNYAPALNRLGMFYTFGMAGVDKDYKKAVKLFENASKQGLETAHCNLAYMYASGKGVFQNLGRAHAFAKEGVENKNEICMNVWKIFKLAKYPEDKGWKFNFYNKPSK